MRDLKSPKDPPARLWLHKCHTHPQKPKIWDCLWSWVTGNGYKSWGNCYQNLCFRKKTKTVCRVQKSKWGNCYWSLEKMVNHAYSNEIINKKVIYDTESICNCESTKVMSRQNVWNFSCLLLMVYIELWDTRDELRRELLSFQAETQEIQRSQHLWVGK